MVKLEIANANRVTDSNLKQVPRVTRFANVLTESFDMYCVHVFKCSIEDEATIQAIREL